MYRVLILEPDGRIAQLQKRFVDNVDGFETVAIAQSQSEAFTSIEILEPNLVIMEVDLPVEQGIDLIAQIRRKKLNIDFIVVSKIKDIINIRTLLRLGVTDFILKPMPFSRLQQSLLSFKNSNKIFNLPKIDEQSQLDFIFNKSLSTNEVTLLPLPKGIDETTLNSVRQTLNGHCEQFYNAEEFGSLAGLSRTTMRRYLDYLVELKEMEVKNIHGSIGRPERKYILKG